MLSIEELEITSTHCRAETRASDTTNPEGYIVTNYPITGTIATKAKS
jgi:hypothetical protein